MATVNQRSSGSELMSSIAVVRQLLLQDLPLTATRNHRGGTLGEDLSAVQQSRHEERLKFEEERKALQEIVEDLKRRVDQAKQEAQQEKTVRLSLEETNEALEKHNAELSAQLDELSSIQSKQTNFDVDEPTNRSENLESLHKENEDLVSRLSSSHKELEQVKEQSRTWKQQCLASQRQVKELQVELHSFKKRFEAGQTRHKELLHNQGNHYQSFQDRLEESVAARKKAEEELKAINDKALAKSNSKEFAAAQIVNDESDVHRKYEEALTLKRKAEEKVAHLDLALEAMKRGKSEEEIMLEQERKEVVEQKVVTLTASLEKMQGQADALKNQMEELSDELISKSASDKLEKVKEEYALGVTKVGAVLECIEVQLKEKLALAKIKVEDCSTEFKRAREELQAAKETVTLIQSEVIDCQIKLKNFTKAIMDSSTAETAATKEASIELAPSPIKGEAAAKKRASTENTGKAVNKRKKAK